MSEVKSQTLHVLVTPEQRNEIAALAAQEGRSVSNMLRRMIQLGISRVKAEHRWRENHGTERRRS